MRTFGTIAAVVILLALGTVAYAQPRAWRDIAFGMNTAQIEQQLRGYDDVSTIGDDYASAIRFGFYFNFDIGNVRYYLHFDLHEDQLMRVRLRSIPVSATYFDSDVRYAQSQLVELMTRARGTPDQTADVGFLAVREGITWTHAWFEDEEGVERWIGLEGDRYRYSATLWIQYLPIVRAVQAQLEESQDDAVNDAADDF